MSVVNVLTPNGRRQNVKVQPNTAILKVLEEVCEKHKFDPNEYDLKHHKRILDLTTSFRFSGLPNNAQLEMVEAQKKRQNAEVELVVQLSDGTRSEGKFTPNITLLSIIEQLCPNELTGDDLVAIYMRTNVANNQLNSTTLKELGLISGRAIIRLMHRDPNAAKIHANVALNLQPKPTETKDEVSVESSEPMSDDREHKIRKTDDVPKDNSLSSLLQNEIDKKKLEMAANETKVEQQQEVEMETEAIKSEPSTSNAHVKEVKEEKMETQPFEPSSSNFNIEDDQEIGETHILGERSAVLFTLDAASANNLSDLPDSYFDLSVNDLKLLIKDLRTQAEGSVEQPLMTSKLREMEEEQRQLSMLNRYKTVIIRIQFPNRYVLQGTFTPYETIATVIEFVQSYLANRDIDFYLYTTPPKSILSKELRLFEANCVPSAILHFGSDDKQANYLNEDILTKLSCPKASLRQALIDRGIKQAAELSLNATLPNENCSHSSSCTSQPTKIASNFSTAPKASTSGETAKLPKWFKPFGK